MSVAHDVYSFKELPGSEREAIAIAKLLDCTPLLHDDATKEILFDAANICNILHLSTHGVIDREKPLDSFIVLADGKTDGILKAQDIMHWSLPCELITLSACQTGLGKQSGEGVIGLS